MSLKEKLSNASLYIIPILLIGLWIIGAFHGKKKHNVDLFSSSFFVCWYYGLETMWHKTDYKELNDNVRVAIYLLMANTQTIDPKEQLEFNQSKKDFKKVLENLDSKEIGYIKKGTETYLAFKDDFENQCYNAFLNYQETKNFILKQSDKSIQLTKELSTYGLEKEMKEATDGIENVSKQIKEKIEANPNYIDEILVEKEKLEANVKDGIEARKKIFQELFNY